jgi:VanZ family protein
MWRSRAPRLLVLVAWMGLITYWSGQGNLPIDQPPVANALHGFQHRLAHLVTFALVGLLARWAFDGLPRATLLAVFLTSVFGASDEWHQSFTPGRRPAIDDWALDTLAAALALYLTERVRATRLEPYLRAITPLVVSAAFFVGVGLAVRPALSSELRGLGVRAVGHAALQFARDTRDVARQLRATVTG